MGNDMPVKTDEKFSVSHVRVLPVEGSSDVQVVNVKRDDRWIRMISGQLDVLEVWYREKTRAPRIYDRLGTWTDVTTRYAMAPLRDE